MTHTTFSGMLITTECNGVAIRYVVEHYRYPESHFVTSEYVYHSPSQALEAGTKRAGEWWNTLRELGEV